MQSDSIKDLSRYIVKELHYGSIIPGNRAEMWRDIYLNSGAIIKGSVFGNNLTILNTDVLIEGTVYVRGEIKITQESYESGKEIIFGSTVVTPDSLLIEVNKNKVRFNSDLYVNKININNAIIYGNVYCSSAIIKNSIILGGVFCKNKLQIENSIIYTFDTNEIDVRQNVSLLSPIASSRKPFHLEYPVRGLTFFNLKDHDNDESFVLELNNDDIIELKMTIEENSHSKEFRYILSLADRVLNSSDIIKSFRQNKMIIELLSLGTHLDKDYLNQLNNFKKEDFEKELWCLIDKEIEISTHEKRAKLNDVLRNIYA